MFDEPALIVTDGGLAGLLACFIEGVCKPVGAVSEDGATGARKRPVAWCVCRPEQAAQREARLAAARHAGTLAHLGAVIEGRVEAHSGPTDLRATGQEQSRMLLAAGAEALRQGLTRIVWPIHLGGPGGEEAEARGGASGSEKVLERIADACDRSLVCGRLLSIEAPETGVTIQTPFVDFTDEQIADLAADVNLPIDAAFLGASESERTRWRRALGRAGLPMPAADATGLSPTVRRSIASARA